MDSCRISSLPDVLLVLILSYLSFKDKIKTSVLSKRWRSLCYETKDIAFKESEYVDHFVSDNHSKRVSFVRYMTQWVSRVNSEVIESFEICFSDPVGFKTEIESLIQFAVSKKVKKLVLDFSNPLWRNTCDVLRLEYVVEFPPLVYSLTTLESLKIYACRFDPERFENLGLLRKLSIGWFRLNEIQSLLSKFPSLESLGINYCWGIIDSMVLAGQIKEFVFENCSFPALISCSLNLPNLDIFKYSGDVINFRFENVNTILKEVYLDFGAEYTYDEPTYSNKDAGEILSQLLNDLRSTKTLTVCPYLLEMIQECDDPVHMLRDVETQNLVLETNLHPKEFNGIRLLLDNCPDLETLTLDILSPSPFNTASYDVINPQTSWLQNIASRCLRRTLKVVVIKHFCGGWEEFYVLNYLVRPEHGHVLERVELYVPNWLEDTQRTWAHVAAAMLQRTSNRVQVIVHNG